MSDVTLEHIKSEHARVGALLEQYEKQSTTTDFVIDRVVIPLPVGARVAGPMFKEDGTVDYYLILHAGESSGSHSDVTSYATERGLKLPNRREGRLLQAAFPDECAKGSIWLEEDYDGDPASAWFQDCYYGLQGGHHKSAELRGVAVSRFTI